MTERKAEQTQNPLVTIARRIQIREQLALNVHGITPGQEREVAALANLSLLAITHRAPSGLTARVVQEFVQYSGTIIHSRNIK